MQNAGMTFGSALDTMDDPQAMLALAQLAWVFQNLQEAGHIRHGDMHMSNVLLKSGRRSMTFRIRSTDAPDEPSNGYKYTALHDVYIIDWGMSCLRIQVTPQRSVTIGTADSTAMASCNNKYNSVDLGFFITSIFVFKREELRYRDESKNRSHFQVRKPNFIKVLHKLVDMAFQETGGSTEQNERDYFGKIATHGGWQSGSPYKWAANVKNAMSPRSVIKQCFWGLNEYSRSNHNQNAIDNPAIFQHKDTFVQLDVSK